MDVLEFELEIGKSLRLGSLTLTIVDIQEDEVCVRLDDEISMLPLRLSEIMPRVPK